jgi:ribosomal protein S12 methylthiotransferase accessory factor
VYFFCEPVLFDTTTNGLASGNHLAEATLHALYELVERDAMTRLSVDGVMRIRDHARVVDPASIDHDGVRAMIDRIESAATTVVLMWLPSAIPVHTVWAVTVNHSPLAAVSTLNVGWGTHVDLGVAASRAVTEAAQSRLALIHGAREDIQAKPVARVEDVSGSAAVRYFTALEPTTTWDDLRNEATVPFHEDLEILLDRVVAELARAGHARLIRFDLTDPGTNIPVVKVVVPTLRFNHRLF